MNSQLDTQITSCLADISQQDWDDLSAGRPFASYQWYSYGEKVLSASQPYYLIVYDHGRAVARATFWTVRDQPLPRSLRSLRKPLSFFFRYCPLLVCRSPVSDTSGLILPNSPLRAAALQAILTAARRVGQKAHASFLIFDYLTPSEAELHEWPAPISKYSLSDPGTYLPLQWESYDEYLKGMSKQGWKKFRYERNKAAQMGLEVTGLPEVDRIDEAMPLIRSVEERHNSSPKPWARAMLEQAGMVPSTWVSARIDGRLVGCAISLADENVQIATLLGLDYNCKDVYFQIIYALVRNAIEHGSSVLRMGSGAYDFKQDLGFQMEYQNYLRYTGQNPLFRLVGTLAAHV